MCECKEPKVMLDIRDGQKVRVCIKCGKKLPELPVIILSKGSE